MEHYVHKINISEEAEFDVECIDAPFEFDKRKIKKELEEFIENNKKYQFKTYFRLKDFVGDLEIMYFIRKGQKFGNMQIWNVLGICEAQYWSEEMEESGIIRSWYETKLNPDMSEPDWVEQMRERQILEERERKIEEEQQRKYDRLFS